MSGTQSRQRILRRHGNSLRRLLSHCYLVEIDLAEESSCSLIDCGSALLFISLSAGHLLAFGIFFECSPSRYVQYANCSHGQ